MSELKYASYVIMTRSLLGFLNFQEYLIKTVYMFNKKISIQNISNPPKISVIQKCL